MLHLKLPTDPRWVNIASMNIEDILVDHAYCEQKAASHGISIIVQFPEHDKLVDQISAIVAEEWGHFELVLSQLRKRGFSLGKKRKDEYVARLIQFEQKGGRRTQQLVDKLLINALIEARSCERFKLLSEHIEDQELKKFYYDLMVSEASHYTTFITLAREFEPRELVDARWQELLIEEKRILETLEMRSDRIH